MTYIPTEAISPNPTKEKEPKKNNIFIQTIQQLHFEKKTIT